VGGVVGFEVSVLTWLVGTGVTTGDGVDVTGAGVVVVTTVFLGSVGVGFVIVVGVDGGVVGCTTGAEVVIATGVFCTTFCCCISAC
jgi:hypothetical protein